MVMMFCSPPYKQVGERQRRFGFADAAGADQQKDADRFLGIVQPCARGTDALADAGQSVILADDASAQVLFERQHRRDFVLQHLADGDAGPAGNHFADNLRIHGDAD